MPRRNAKSAKTMMCSCGKRIPLSYAKTHIDRCQRAKRKHRRARGDRYPKESRSCVNR